MINEWINSHKDTIIKRAINVVIFFVVWIVSSSMCPDNANDIVSSYFIIGAPILLFIIKIVYSIIKYKKREPLHKSFILIILAFLYFLSNPCLGHLMHSGDMVEMVIDTKKNKIVLIINLLVYIPLVLAGCLLPLANGKYEDLILGGLCLTFIGSAFAILLVLIINSMHSRVH